MKTAATATELNRLVNRWAEHSAEIDSASLAKFSDNLAAIFGVEADEVAILAITGNRRHLCFLVPEKLRAVGRFTSALMRGERAPFPDARLANVGGALFPALGRRWRARR